MKPTILTMAARCGACALANTPASVRCIQIQKELSGFACTNPKGPDFGMLCAPRPVTPKALYIFLHECAHFALGHRNGRKHRHVEELEAEQWAHARMREAGIAVPRSMSQRAREYVGYKVRQAIASGVRVVDRRAAKFGGIKDEDVPKPRPKRKAYIVGYIVSESK